ncbi:hypothetical protein GCM10011428_79950 [Streptomyces violaceus]
MADAGTAADPQTGVGAAAPGVAAAAAAQAGLRGGATASATQPHPRTDPTPDAPEATPQPLTPTAITEPIPTTDTAPPSPTPPGPSRRLFVSRVVAGAAAAAAVGTVGYGTYGVLRGPKVKRVTVPLAKLPRAAHGFRIAVVSDIHLGPVLGRGFAQTVVDTINATQPDLIAVVGDLVDGQREGPRPRGGPTGPAEGPSRVLLRHRQPRVLLRRRTVGRGSPAPGPQPPGERPQGAPVLRPGRSQRHRG